MKGKAVGHVPLTESEEAIEKLREALCGPREWTPGEVAAEALERIRIWEDRAGVLNLQRRELRRLLMRALRQG